MVLEDPVDVIKEERLLWTKSLFESGHRHVQLNSLNGESLFQLVAQHGSLDGLALS